MHKCETFQLKDKRRKWVKKKNPKSNEMLVTKLHNRKYRQVIIIKSKMKFKDTSGNAKRKKAAATFQYQRKTDFKA